jgi:Flp pilus assembly protein TadD
MKKLFFLLILIGFGLRVNAQNSAVTKAETFLNSGELDKAKEQITLALANEKTRDKGKTYFVKGKIFESIYADKTNKFASLATNPVDSALAAYNKAISLEGKNSLVRGLAEAQINILFNLALNKGADAYQANDYKSASDHFATAARVNPTDTTGFLYWGIAAQQMQDYKSAETAFKKLLTLNYATPDIYNSLIFFARNEKNDEKALQILKEAKTKYPNEKTFAEQELNILISSNKVDEAKQKLMEQIATNPNDAVLHYNLGFMYEQTKDIDKATASYKKATELNPQYFEAFFNLGVINYNKAAEVLKEVNNMDLSTYQKIGKKREAEGVEMLKVGLPYFEQAHKINATDATVIETLQNIYIRLGRTADAERMKKLLEGK